ncbi:MAG: hypothetical protein DWI27_02440 [Planctomycetota bacterium]|nr:MAG: hypothetical protein DWI27_02440 [Planctomycetota bacterium]
MSTAAIRSSRTARVPTREAGASNRGLWVAVIAGLVLLALIAAWFLGWISFVTDPRVTEIQQLQQEAQKQFGEGGGPKTIVEATAAVTAMNTIRTKVEALPSHLRPQVEREGGSMFRSAFRARIDSYFAAAPEKRQAELDRQIDQEEMMRKAFDAGRAIAGVFGGGQGSQATGGTAQGGTTPGGTSGGGPPAPTGSSSSGSSSEERSNKWRKSMIDRTTPEQRSRYVEYRRAMDERREQRGLPGGWGR